MGGNPLDSDRLGDELELRLFLGVKSSAFDLVLEFDENNPFG